ncbi:Uma2 family endonuclease [Streptomyces sp. NPDC012888]|uniref:Uma2 family endonuclease n=1 Tax=Streptomyces sp. NPDC012888 TaxID=3364855 RepID=UPI003678A0F3
MITVPEGSRQGASAYSAMREALRALDDTVPGKFEITREGIVHDMTSPGRPHEVTAALVGRRLERVMPDGFWAHTGTPDVEDEPEGVLRHPDVMVIAFADMEGEGAFDAREVLAAVEVVSRSNPDNDWVGKMRDYPLMGVPVYAVFDPRTGTGAVMPDIHDTPEGPRYATRKDFVYGEDVTIAGWTISTEGLPRYAPEGQVSPAGPARPAS